ncbi:hypothetical protein Fleli_3865 [Bernardetia litoralis DSM 6794]|uniref:Uncharacterized protein n=1 Tax=Bernardetia litoralis (strain ATCC 23117 / DSM 6794 / NBRC 15988 / NCIMB 1366 / Fx l1 / Sio-4) TaxID=880071 RepID=I4AQD5_BERLS|nr:hypothetical protein [Bernardetia litoralis]AFM06170.1 hypothetical protein Fleli_3865 [Bernardetia litoralis DSM 6794]
MSYLKIETSILTIISTSIDRIDGFIILNVGANEDSSFALFIKDTSIDFRKNQELQTKCAYSSIYWEGNRFLVVQIQLKSYSYDSSSSTVHIKGKGQIKEDEDEDFYYNLDFECTFQIPSIDSSVSKK